MLIKNCFDCNFHEIKREEEGQMSYCQRENCWAQYSKCVAYKALDRFLKDECVKTEDVSNSVLRSFQINKNVENL